VPNVVLSYQFARFLKLFTLIGWTINNMRYNIAKSPVASIVLFGSINQSIINDLRCPYPLIVIKDTIIVPQLSEQECFQVLLESKETLAGTKFLWQFVPQLRT
jgi:hypothetical protein